MDSKGVKELHTEPQNCFFTRTKARLDGDAFNSFVPQIVPDKVPNMSHIIEVSKLFVVFSCFLCQIARWP